MTIILYHSVISPFSRSVLLFARYLNIDVDVKILDLMNQEQMTEEFLKINPQHCVPTIDDNGFYLWESRAILSYLMETKAPHLLPTSPKEKAVINQRLYHEMGTLTQKFIDLIMPIFSGQSTEFNQDKVKELKDVFAMIDEFYFPNGNEWIAGEHISVADFAYMSGISTLVAIGVSLENYPRISAWFERCKKTFPDYEEVNEKGIQMFAQVLLPKITKGF